MATAVVPARVAVSGPWAMVAISLTCPFCSCRTLTLSADRSHTRQCRSHPIRRGEGPDAARPLVRVRPPASGPCPLEREVVREEARIMTNTAAPAVPAHNHLVLTALATDVGRRVL